MKGMHYSLECLNLCVCLKDFIMLILNYWAKLNPCVHSVDLKIKAQVTWAAPQQFPRILRQANQRLYHELVLHPGTTLASCSWDQKLLLSHAEELCRLIHSDQQGFPSGGFPLFLSGILDKIKQLSHYWEGRKSLIWVIWNLPFLLPFHLYFFVVLREKLAIPTYRYSLSSQITEPKI